MPSHCQPVDTAQQVIQSVPSPAPTLSTQGTQPGGGNCQPCPVDCNKPKVGEPHTCINKPGCKEHWCSQCPKGGQWGNHLTKGHDKWLKLFLKHKEKQKQKFAQNQEQTQATAANTNQGSANQGESTLGSNGAANVSLPSLSQMFCHTYVMFNDSSDNESSWSFGWTLLKCLWPDASEVSVATTPFLSTVSWEGYPGWWHNMLHRKYIWPTIHVLCFQLSLKHLVNLCCQCDCGIRTCLRSLLPLSYGTRDWSLWEEAQLLETIKDLAHVSFGVIMHQHDIGTSSKFPSAQGFSA